MNDTFPKWILGVASAAVVAIGGGLLTTMIGVREDMAVVKAHVAELKATTQKVDNLERLVIGHDYRIIALERDGVVKTHDTMRVQHGQ